MAIFKTADLNFLRFYSLAVGILGTALFLSAFFGYFLIQKHGTLTDHNPSFLNLHCAFMMIGTFFQVSAGIVLIVGCIKKSHQEIRVWLILSPVGWIFMIVALLSLLKYLEYTYIDTRYVPVVVACVLINLISYDIVYSYYLNRREFAYVHLREYNVR